MSLYLSIKVGYGRGVTGDHCEAIAAKAMLKGPPSDVKNRQCFHLVDARRGTILAGLFVPGTGMEHLRPAFAEVGSRTGVKYDEYYADNPPCGRKMIEEELGTKEMVMGTGHLERRLNSSINSGCLDSAEHGADVARILRDEDGDVVENIKTLLLKPGGLPKGCKVMVKAATPSSTAVMKTWSDNDNITVAVLARMVDDGSFKKTFKKNIPAKVVPTSIKEVRFKEYVEKWNPYKAGDAADLCEECGRQSLYASGAKRCEKGCSAWTSTTPTKAANFHKTMVNFHKETEPLAISDSKVIL